MNLLVCDIGNTSIKFGMVKDADSASEPAIHASYVFSTRTDTTPDSFGFELMAALRQAGLEKCRFEACVASSVVPAMNQTLRLAVERYAGCKCLFAAEDLPVPLQNHYARPAEVGADLLVGAYAAHKLLPEAQGLLVIDYGTAATFACVDGDAFMGGLIFPGPATAASALALKTAKLPYVSLEATGVEPAPGKDTVTCIRHGLIFGYVAVTEGLCARLAKQLPQPLKIVATGGFAKTIASLTTVFDLVEPNLLLLGLARLYKENTNNL